MQQAGSLITLLAVMGATALLFNRTSVGLRLRAVAQNPASATLLGQHQGLWLMVGWAVAAAVGAFAAVVAAPVLTLSPGMMTFPLPLALAAGTLGGLSSRVGAVVGGILIGIADNLASRYVPGLDRDLAIIAPFALTALIVMLRPAGLFGIFMARSPIEPPAWSGLTEAQFGFLMCLVALALTLLVLRNLVTGRLGRAFAAVRTSALLAAANGVDVNRTKLMAFAVSAAVAGTGGAFYALVAAIAVPDSYLVPSRSRSSRRASSAAAGPGPAPSSARQS